MRIISFCADGIREAAKKGFYDWVIDQDADFICVQNLKAQEYDLQSDVFWPQGYNPYFFDAVDKDLNGVAIYCREMPKAIMTGLGFVDFDMEGRYIQADFQNISIGCLLAPSAAKEDNAAKNRKKHFFDLFQNHLSKVRNKRREFVICGNWNMTHNQNDLQDFQSNQNVPGCSPEEQQWMDHTMTELGYVDAFREVNSDNDEFTWWPEGKQGENGWRVDLQIVSSGLKSAIEYGAIYKNQQFSNHAPLIMDYDYEM
ncbi:exodeoxyribonuclease III [marine gamma proteobacterium HTCC2143]|jgi:exodeoxyribonuclease-3|uniref:Exodeoxyribonuclease III n=1 Tax=marine gamma proteobacterium HTCC2143 TaxID=247633 RepID=A0Y9L5_9GAMM|nr:exodeoxyribonuclease III [marine gamma proteobacterium HTCC2143]